MKKTLVLLFLLLPVFNFSEYDTQSEYDAQKERQQELIDAAREGDINIVKNRIFQGVNINARGYGAIRQYGGDGTTALIEAAAAGHTEIVQLLLNNGANVNMTNESMFGSGLTALMVAVWGGHTKMVKMLLDKGANVDLRDSSGETALIAAARSKNLLDEMVDMLLSKKPYLNFVGLFSRTALTYAVLNGHMYFVTGLLENGADFNLKDCYGYTARMYAIQTGWWNDEFFKKYTPKKNHDDEIALLIAVEQGNADTVQYLISKGVDIEVKNKKGLTALMISIEKRDERMVMILLSNWANANAKNSEGRSPLDIALEKGNPEIVKWLRNAGAR